MTELERVVTKLATSKPKKAYPLLHQAFVVFAGAGRLAHAEAVIRLAYDPRLPRPSKPVDILGTAPMDAICVVGDFGDLTKGEPNTEYLARANGLAARVQAGGLLVRGDLVRDAYPHSPRPSGHWSTLAGTDLWRTIQILAVDGTAGEAFAALTKYMDSWCETPEERGAGYGKEIILALDFAVHLDATQHLERWIAAVGRHLVLYTTYRVAQALCLTGVAGAIGGGLLAPLFDLSDEDADRHLRAIEAAVAQLIAAPEIPSEYDPTTPTRREVSGIYSQFSLEHENPPRHEVFFQDAREFDQGMSIFGSQVGIATPNETASCTVEIQLRRDPAPTSFEDAVQAVAFPFTVKGPLFVRSATGGDEDDPVVLPHGTYDVLARFFPAPAPEHEAEVGLRVFRVALDFHPAGSLGAPRCIKLEWGTPPETIFVQQ